MDDVLHEAEHIQTLECILSTLEWIVNHLQPLKMGFHEACIPQTRGRPIRERMGLEISR